MAHALVRLAFLALPALGAPDARAQAPVATWTVEGVADRFCISYLVEPALAARQLGSRFTPVPAERVEGLHPALARLVADDPPFRAWVPAEICVIEAARVVSGARTANEGSRPLVLGYAGMAATPANGGEAIMRGSMFSTSGTVRRLATDQLIHLDGVKYTRGVVPDGTDQRRTLGYQGATLTWDGRILDPANPAAPHPVRLAVDGKQNRALAAGVSQTADWERAAVGNLRIQGKSDFAQGLIGSPIRMVGPVAGGGSITLDFERR